MLIGRRQGLTTLALPLMSPNFGRSGTRSTTMVKPARQDGFVLGPVVAELSMKYLPGPDSDAVLNMAWSPDAKGLLPSSVPFRMYIFGTWKVNGLLAVSTGK